MAFYQKLSWRLQPQLKAEERRLLVLLSLAFTTHLLAAKEFLRNERMSPELKHAADSLINKDQLEQVMEYLQDAVHQANKQKDDHTLSSVDDANEMATNLKSLYHQLQQLLMEPDLMSPADDILKLAMSLVEKLSMYIDSKKKSLTAEVEDVERELEDILKMPDFLVSGAPSA